MSELEKIYTSSNHEYDINSIHVHDFKYSNHEYDTNSIHE